jgi:hypothetical protein
MFADASGISSSAGQRPHTSSLHYSIFIFHVSESGPAFRISHATEKSRELTMTCADNVTVVGFAGRGPSR